MKPETEIRYLERCIELANQCSAGIGTPLVGAILVSQDGTIIGEGYRQFIDGTQLTLHAERIAITQAKGHNINHNFRAMHKKKRKTRYIILLL